jgi:hypothetical protein
MSLGFTKRIAYLNLYFKVEDGEPVILLLYVDDLFLIGVKKLITEDVGYRIRDERFRNDALLLGTRSLVEIRWDFPKSRKVCRGNLDEVRDVAL